MIKIEGDFIVTDDVADATLVTRNGSFNLDLILSTVLLKKVSVGDVVLARIPLFFAKHLIPDTIVYGMSGEKTFPEMWEKYGDLLFSGAPNAEKSKEIFEETFVNLMLSENDTSTLFEMIVSLEDKRFGDKNTSFMTAVSWVESKFDDALENAVDSANA